MKTTGRFIKSFIRVLLVMIIIAAFPAVDADAGTKQQNTKGMEVSKSYVAPAQITHLYNDATGIRIVWKKSTAATAYRVYRYYTKNGEGHWVRLKTIYDTNTTSYIDKDISNNYGWVYGYVVDITTRNGDSDGRACKYIRRLKKPVLYSCKSIGNRKAYLTWSKRDVADGYQIKYSVNSDFSNRKTASVNSNQKTGFTISNLTPNTRYYFSVRSFKYRNGNKDYSGWSATKSAYISSSTSPSTAYAAFLSNKSRTVEVLHIESGIFDYATVRLNKFSYSKQKDINGDGIPELMLSNFRSVTSNTNEIMILTYSNNEVVPLVWVTGYGGYRFGAYIYQNMLVFEDSGSKNFYRQVIKIRGTYLDIMQDLYRSWDTYLINNEEVSKDSPEWYSALNAYDAGRYVSKITF